VDHTAGAHGDLINAIAGAVVEGRTHGRQQTADHSKLAIWTLDNSDSLMDLGHRDRSGRSKYV
jgi:hypothetical protein